MFVNMPYLSQICHAMCMYISVICCCNGEFTDSRRLTLFDDASNEVINVGRPDPELLRHDKKSIATSEKFHITVGTKLVVQMFMF